MPELAGTTVDLFIGGIPQFPIGHASRDAVDIGVVDFLHPSFLFVSLTRSTTLCRLASQHFERRLGSNISPGEQRLLTAMAVPCPGHPGVSTCTESYR